MRSVLRTAIRAPLVLGIALLMLVAIGVRLACLELLRSRPCLAL
jgi:hypothetical protein